MSCWVTDNTRDAWYTTDAGTTWTGRGYYLNGVSSIDSIFCVSLLDCFATATTPTGYAVMYTTDGGPWTVVPVPTPGSLFCASASRCWLAGGDRGPEILATSDGGQTWAIQSTFPSLPRTLTFASISCSDSQHCVATANDPRNPGNPNYPDGIASTTNGGSTWILQKAPPGFANVYGVSCFGINTCMAVAAPSGENGGGSVIETFDGAATWITGYSSASFSTTIDCLTSGTCWAAGLFAAPGVAQSGSVVTNFH